MKNFKISNLWQNKQKHHTQKHKRVHSSSNQTRTVKDDWDMSPEDALRIAYAAHK